jgi:hypothetical protein
VSVKIKKLALYNSGSPIEIGLYYMNAADTGASNLKDATGLTLTQSYNHTPSGSGWETVSFSATLPANAANGLCLRFNYARTDMGAGEIFAIAQVQLEVGSKASAFERRPYGMELALCQRYFYSAHNSLALIAGTAATTSALYMRYVLPVSPRVSPTVSFVGVGVGNTFTITDDFTNDFATTAPTVVQPISLATGLTGRINIQGFGGVLVVGRIYNGCENSASTARTWFSMEL